MRLSTQQFFLQGSTAITDVSTQVQRTQQQISSNQRLLSAADDPVAATRILKIEAQLSVNNQFTRNIDLAESRLQIIEGSLSSVEEVILRVKELVIRSGNGALSNNERSKLAIEIDERLDELVDLVNTRDADGDYIFGGFQVDSPPFVENSGQYQYTGDEGVRLVQVSNSSYVAISEPGDTLFQSIPVVNNQVVSSEVETNISNVSIVDTEITDQATFDAIFPEDYIVEFGNINNVAPPGPNYSITRRSDGGGRINRCAL